MLNNNFFVGVVEDRRDPEALGRCKVRIVGLHTHDLSLLPTEDLPWAMPIVPITSAAMNGIGQSPTGPIEGTTVIVMFADRFQQQPIMMGAVGGLSGKPLSQEDINIDTRARPVEPANVELVTNNNVPSGSTTIPFNTDQDLTGIVRPNWTISGAGFQDGTIVTAVTPNTITISRPTIGSLNGDLPSFGEAPTNLAALQESNATRYLQDGNGNPVTTSSGNPIEVEAVPNAIAPDRNSTNDQIPTVPPPQSTSDTGKASYGINAIIAACDEVGLTTKEQKCALLGIAGGESRWIPQNESYNYSKERMAQIYRFASADERETWSRAPRKGISRFDFFSWAYGPTKRGANFLGNRTDADGGRYYGRGFIQLTGRGNYERYQRLATEAGLNIDIVNNPDTLNTDIRTSAIVSALYLKDRVSKDVSPSDHPGYFFAAKRAVGVNSPDIAKIKQDYYEYFYGAAATGTIPRSAGTPYAGESEPYSGAPAPSREQQERGSQQLGFRDPNSKYPIEEMQDENHTNRNARGERVGVNWANKLSTRHTDIPRPLSLGGWSQPLPTYSPKYPFNHVRESESGHIEEWDDTPGYERVSTWHRSGSYYEIDPNGTRINYIVGDDFTLVENNGNVHIAGQCNITVDGDTNIFARSNANIEVAADANIEVGNNVNMGVTNDVNWVVGGNMTLKVEKDLTIDSNNYTRLTDLATNIRTTTLTQNVLGDTNLLNGGNYYLETTGNMNIYGDGYFKATSTDGMHLLDSTKVNIESSGTLDMLSGGVMNVDYSTGNFGDGADSAEGALPNITKVARPSQGEFSIFIDEPDIGEPIDEDVDEEVWGTDEVDDTGREVKPFVPLYAPALEKPLNGNKEQLTPPPSQAENPHETPDEWSSATGRRESNILRTEQGDPNAANLITAEDSVAAPSGQQAAGREVDTTNIDGTERFTNDFRMSRNFNWGMCYDPSGGHVLKDQNVGGRRYTKQEIVGNMAHLLENCIEPLIANQVLPQGMGGYQTSWRVNSGYRMQSSNPNRQSTSQHCKGQAMDLGLIASPLTNKAQKTWELVAAIARTVPYDQLILEYRYPDQCWIHISYNPSGANRFQAFTMVNDSTYGQGFHLVTRIPPKER